MELATKKLPKSTPNGSEKRFYRSQACEITSIASGAFGTCEQPTWKMLFCSSGQVHGKYHGNRLEPSFLPVLPTLCQSCQPRKFLSTSHQ